MKNSSGRGARRKQTDRLTSVRACIFSLFALSDIDQTVWGVPRAARNTEAVTAGHYYLSPADSR